MKKQPKKNHNRKCLNSKQNNSTKLKCGRTPLFGSMKGKVRIIGDIVNFETTDLWEVLKDPKTK